MNMFDLWGIAWVFSDEICTTCYHAVMFTSCFFLCHALQSIYHPSNRWITILTSHTDFASICPLVSDKETLSLAVIAQRLHERRSDLTERHRKKAQLGSEALAGWMQNLEQ